MSRLECSIIDGKHQILVKPERMMVYLQCKIVEAMDKDHQLYYLYFYKDEYVNSHKATSVRRRSFLEKAAKKGSIFPSSHPFVHSFLSPESSFPKRNINQLLGKLENQYTPQETALILTFFDSFISKKELFQHIQSIFYQYRRNGQMYQGYRILRILLDFTPKHSWVKQMANEMRYTEYKEMYRRLDELLWEKDPLYMEKMYTKKRKNPKTFSTLLDFLMKENRLLDGAALLRDYVRRTGSLDDYENYKQWVETYFSHQNRLKIYEDLYALTPQIESLQYDLLQFYLDSKRPLKAIQLINQHDLFLQEEQSEVLEELITDISPDSEYEQVEQLNTYIASLFKKHPAKAENILLRCVKQLMNSRDLFYISEWLSPIKEKYTSSSIIHRIDMMKKINDDPDQQMKMGEMYYEFNQLQQAIECFSWEMELNTSDPQPVRWLSKLYMEMGKETESKAYQELFRDMQKKKA